LVAGGTNRGGGGSIKKKRKTADWERGPSPSLRKKTDFDIAVPVDKTAGKKGGCNEGKRGFPTNKEKKSEWVKKKKGRYDTRYLEKKPFASKEKKRGWTSVGGQSGGEKKGVKKEKSRGPKQRPMNFVENRGGAAERKKKKSADVISGKKRRASSPPRNIGEKDQCRRPGQKDLREEKKRAAARKRGEFRFF